MTELRFYLDENISPAVAEQLRNSEIEVVTALELEKLGDTDINHLRRAADMGYALCTHDRDYFRLAGEVDDHAGVVFAEQYGATTGGWVKGLKKLHEATSAEDMQGQIRFLNVKS